MAIAIATVGIMATLLAYAISPGVRHAVGHAAHSVRHAVGHVLDPDADHPARSPLGHRPHLVQPLRRTYHGSAGAGTVSARTHTGAG
jgi:hypothetical protein